MDSGDGADGEDVILSTDHTISEFMLDERVLPDISWPVGDGVLIVDLTELEPLCDADLLEPERRPE